VKSPNWSATKLRDAKLRVFWLALHWICCTVDNISFKKQIFQGFYRVFQTRLNLRILEIIITKINFHIQIFGTRHSERNKEKGQIMTREKYKIKCNLINSDKDNLLVLLLNVIK
jgi:hypothetical protein